MCSYAATCGPIALSLYRRAFSSGNVDGACAVLNNARWVWPQGGCGLELFIKLGLPPQLTAADGVQESAAPEAAGLFHCHWVSQATLCSKSACTRALPPSLGLTEMLQGKLPSSRAADRRDSDAGQASHLVGVALCCVWTQVHM